MELIDNKDELIKSTLKAFIGGFLATKMTVDKYGEEHFAPDYQMRFRFINTALKNKIILVTELREEWLKGLEEGQKKVLLTEENKND